jgi:copper chaperone CopZ
MQGSAILRCLPAAILASLTLASIAVYGSPASTHATYEIVADGMCCQGCAKKVAAKLYTAPGVINVKADVPARRVTITAKPSPKLTLEKLWSAVEKAKGKPSRLTTSDAVYSLQWPEQIEGHGAVAANSYTILVADMHDMELAQKVARQLRAVEGIESLSVDLKQGTMLIKPAANTQLSPWTLVTAVNQAGQSARAVTGPYGRLTVEPVMQHAVRSAALTR